jgi:uroporphyrinogen III methyltransferase/synthase
VTVYLVGAGPGDPGLLTRRGADLLARADVVLFDRLVDPRLLELAPVEALRIDVGKRPGQPRHQDDVNALILEHGRRGRTVVRLKGGDPFVFGRGGEEAEALLAAGIPFEVVPGVTSAFAVPASAGVPVTHRGMSSSVTVVTGHVGDPAAPGAVDWVSLSRAGGTLVILMGMAARAEIARRLIEAGRSPDTPVLVVHRGTASAETSVRTTLSGLAEVSLGPPCTIVVGPVAALDLRSGGRGPLTGLRVVVTRPRAQAPELVSALVDAGAAVIELPVIAIADPPDGGRALRAEAARAGTYDWIVFTSSNAVERFVDLLRDGRALGSARLAAVGRATARALAARRLVADLVPDDETAEGLVAAMSVAPATASRRVLFPRAVAAREVLAAGLRRNGWEVTEVDAYRTVPAGAAEGVGDEELDGASASDVITFTSPSTVERYAELAGQRRPPPVVACIGPVTADAARRAGFRVDVVAVEHSADGLVEALAAYVATRAGEPLPPGLDAPVEVGEDAEGERPPSEGAGSRSPRTVVPPSA